MKTIEQKIKDKVLKLNNLIIEKRLYARGEWKYNMINNVDYYCNDGLDYTNIRMGSLEFTINNDKEVEISFNLDSPFSTILKRINKIYKQINEMTTKSQSEANKERISQLNKDKKLINKELKELKGV